MSRDDYTVITTTLAPNGIANHNPTSVCKTQPISAQD